MAMVMVRSSGRPHIDSTHLNPIVQVITWVLFAITTLALIFRLLTRCYLREKRNFAWEDGLILCSYVSGTKSCREMRANSLRPSHCYNQ